MSTLALVRQRERMVHLEEQVDALHELITELVNDGAIDQRRVSDGTREMWQDLRGEELKGE